MMDHCGMELKFKKLRPSAQTPMYHTSGAAAFDLAYDGDGPVTLYPHNMARIGTGLAFEVPLGWVMKVYIRSSLGFKHGVQLANGTGIIDSDYRGEVMLALLNAGPQQIIIKPGERVAQGILEFAQPARLIEAQELSGTVRGAGGIGSTGK